MKLLTKMGNILKWSTPLSGLFFSVWILWGGWQLLVSSIIDDSWWHRMEVNFPGSAPLSYRGKSSLDVIKIIRDRDMITPSKWKDFLWADQIAWGEFLQILLTVACGFPGGDILFPSWSLHGLLKWARGHVGLCQTFGLYLGQACYDGFWGFYNLGLERKHDGGLGGLIVIMGLVWCFLSRQIIVGQEYI